VGETGEYCQSVIGWEAPQKETTQVFYLAIEFGVNAGKPATIPDRINPGNKTRTLR
jgi:hypothetical protein